MGKGGEWENDGRRLLQVIVDLRLSAPKSSFDNPYQ